MKIEKWHQDLSLLNKTPNLSPSLDLQSKFGPWVLWELVPEQHLLQDVPPTWAIIFLQTKFSRLKKSQWLNWVSVVKTSQNWILFATSPVFGFFFSECTKKVVNLVFLFDGSGSMTEDEFTQNKVFIKDIMTTLNSTSIKVTHYSQYCSIHSSLVALFYEQKVLWMLVHAFLFLPFLSLQPFSSPQTTGKFLTSTTPEILPWISLKKKSIWRLWPTLTKLSNMCCKFSVSSQSVLQLKNREVDVVKGKKTFEILEQYDWTITKLLFHLILKWQSSVTFVSEKDSLKTQLQVQMQMQHKSLYWSLMETPVTQTNWGLLKDMTTRLLSVLWLG